MTRVLRACSDLLLRRRTVPFGARFSGAKTHAWLTQPTRAPHPVLSPRDVLVLLAKARLSPFTLSATRSSLVTVGLFAVLLHAELANHETFDVLGKALGHVRFEGLQKRLENTPLPGCWNESLVKHQNRGGIHWIPPRAPATPHGAQHI